MSRQAADAAFDRGDYRSARSLYTPLLQSEEDKTHAEQRLAALTSDKLELWLGLGTLSFIVVAYILARLV